MGRPDYAMQLRAATLIAMKSSPAITAMIPASSMYRGTVPAGAAWPLSKIASVIVSPFVADGLNSTNVRMLIQGCAKDIVSSGTVTMTAEDAAWNIGSAFKVALDGAVLPLAGGGKAVFEWERSIPLQDPDEASIWYVTSTFEIEITPP